jgi:hypothetical protein
VRQDTSPILDARDAAAVLAELLARQPAYVPELIPSEKGPAHALLQIFARYMQAVTARLNQAPDKNLLAFLDTLGVSLIPAHAARAPVVFTALPDTGDGRIEGRTRLGADVPGAPDPIPFETERGMALAGARLLEITTLWPARDEYADHSIELAGGRPVTLFQPRRAVPHELYLAHQTLFAFTGETTVHIRFELGNPAVQPLAIAWEFWDGQIWQRFATFDAANGSRDGTGGLTRSGIVRLKVPCGEAQTRPIQGIEAYWIRARIEKALSPDPAQVLPSVDRIQLRSEMSRMPTGRPETVPDAAAPSVVATGGLHASHAGLAAASRSAADFVLPDEAFANGLAVDLTNTFYPFGQQPQPGSTFYFTSNEVFTKPGATMFLSISIVLTRSASQGETELDTPVVNWEYWNGSEWALLASRSGEFKFSTVLSLPVPTDLVPVEVNNNEKLWMRVRLARGAYGFKRQITYQTNPGPLSFTIVETVPPAVDGFRLGYIYRSPWEYPQHCLTYNDFQFELHTDDVRRPGNFFPPFRPVADTTPVLYLGFDRPLPNDLVSLYVDVREQDVTPSPLTWEAWDGTSWKKLSVADETAHLTRPGLVSFVAPDVAPRPEARISGAAAERITASDALAAAVFQPNDRIVVQQDATSEMATVREVNGEVIVLETPLTRTYTGGRVAHAALPRFGRPLDWIRARLKDDGAPFMSILDGVYLNATWARQVQTIENEVLGSGTAEPGQSVFFSQAPVLREEAVEVRELEGARAAVELPMLQEELRRHAVPDDALRIVSDQRLGRVTEVWVRWQSRPHLFFSGPDDRHYVVERARGRVIFGDGLNGRIPPVGPNNIVAARYQVGGGTAGNVPAGTITQLLGSAAIVQSVTNPRAGDGGATGETIESVKRRGPQRLRHLGRALSAADYEALAREASAGVAMARVLPATAPNGRPAPGWVTVIVVPQSLDPQPQPSFELRQQVHDYLRARASAAMGAAQIAVTGPTYLPIGVFAGVVPRNLSDAGLVETRMRGALERFLHPLTGGPEEEGWPLGRDIYLSDVAALVEGVEGVDFLRELELLLDDIPQGEHIAVAQDRIVVAGPLRIEMQGPES